MAVGIRFMPRATACVLLVGIALAASLCVSCKRSDKANATVNVVGSTSIQPFAELIAKEYMKNTPTARSRFRAADRPPACRLRAEGLADIGTCSRELTANKARQFTRFEIARDGLALVVNLANPINGLTMDQVRRLFSGEITNWKEVGGSDEPVRIVSREGGKRHSRQFHEPGHGEIACLEKSANAGIERSCEGAGQGRSGGDRIYVARTCGRRIEAGDDRRDRANSR